MQASPTSSPNEAFVSALTQYQHALTGYCQAALGLGEDAKEALQRTNIVLWKKCSNWDPDTDFLPWATAVARYEVLGVIRDRKREQRRLLFDSDVAEQMMDAAAKAVAPTPQRLVALEVCLAKVSQENRRVLTAFYSHAQTIEEIATRENRGQSALKMQLKRLRQSLGKCIESQLAKGAAG